MIEEQYISFETSKLLKEKGFKELCHSYYHDNAGKRFVQKSVGANWNDEPIYVSCPTQSVAMRWLREKHELLISVNPTLDKDLALCVMYYIWDVDDKESDAITSGLYSFESYEECVEDAIKYCLKNLV